MKPFIIIIILSMLLTCSHASPEYQDLVDENSFGEFLAKWLNITVPQGSKIQSNPGVINQNIYRSQFFQEGEGLRDIRSKSKTVAQKAARVHVVSRGETLSSISNRYGISVNKLKQYNQLANANKIYTGQQLLMEKKKSTYRIKRGDTLWQLAKIYNCSLTELQRINPTVDVNNLVVGSSIFLPDKKTTAPLTFNWPIIGQITSPFGYRGGALHRGLDIGAKTASVISAAASGTVLEAEWNGYYGLCVLLKHNEYFKTRYAHASKLLVKENQWVKVGEPIALVGSTGKSTGPHLHFEIIKNNKPQDPINYLP